MFLEKYSRKICNSVRNNLAFICKSCNAAIQLKELKTIEPSKCTQKSSAASRHVLGLFEWYGYPKKMHTKKFFKRLKTI